jgi:hypothetical protein
MEPVLHPLKKPNGPTPRVGPKMDIIRLEGGESKQYHSLSPAIHEYMIHWDPIVRRSVHCLEDPTLCEGCKREMPTKYRGYLCIENTVRRQAWVEITNECALDLLAQTATYDSLRGLMIKLTRTPSSKGRLYVDVLIHQARDSKLLAADASPETILRTLWAWGR